ncbi:MAG: PDDEXK nuclease domain-containing protein [Candidatus Sumerlaeota bacterium]|nr:PDDEXK nuclease domain-containing protein [Candidatus Sumerlaeota bacterium]
MPSKPEPSTLLAEVRELILSTRAQLARAVNAGLTMLHWQVGDRVRREILKEKRAGYGEEIVATLSRQLEAEFGRGFGQRNLFRMVRFAEVFPDRRIVSALMTQLGWTHFLHIVPLDDPLQRDFYAEMCRIERWSTRTLEKKIQSMLYERTALSKKPESLIAQELKALREEDRLTPDLVFRDPYVLDFLGLKNAYGEKDLEAAILREIESFLLELGAGFAFIARQKRIQIDSDDFYLDLLFFNRPLRRLIVIDLKLGDFKAEFKGQMDLYLRWLDRNERQAGEEPPLGIILCAGKKREQIEYLELGQSDIHVAEYLTELPPRNVLERQLHHAIQMARRKLLESAESATGSPRNKEGG